MDDAKVDKEYKCPMCEEVNTSEEWDNKTYDECCSNRKLRRSYVSIRVLQLSKWYRCPSCGKDVRRRSIREVL